MLARNMPRFWHTFARSYGKNDSDDGFFGSAREEGWQMGIEGHLWGSSDLPYSLADQRSKSADVLRLSVEEDTGMDASLGMPLSAPSLEDLSIARAAHEMLEQVIASPTAGNSRSGRYLRTLSHALNTCPHGAMERVVAAIYKARSRGSRVYALGLGESSSVASHLARDLGRQQVRAAQLNTTWHAAPREDVVVRTSKTSTASTTPAGRLSQRLEQHLRATLRGHDVLLVVDAERETDHLGELTAALRAARAIGATTLVLTGASAEHVEALEPLADELVPVGCSSTAMLASAHLYLGLVLSTTLDAMERARPSGPLAATPPQARPVTATDEARWNLA